MYARTPGRNETTRMGYFGGWVWFERIAELELKLELESASDNRGTRDRVGFISSYINACMHLLPVFRWVGLGCGWMDGWMDASYSCSKRRRVKGCGRGHFGGGCSNVNFQHHH